MGMYLSWIITLNKPDEITDEQFDKRIDEIEDLFNTMKDIIEAS